MYRVVRRTGDIFGDEPHVCEFVCDTSDDVATLPNSIAEGTGGKSKYDNQKCSAGSTAIIATNSGSNYYILNNSDVWVAQNSGSSGTGTGGSSEETVTLPNEFLASDLMPYTTELGTEGCVSLVDRAMTIGDKAFSKAIQISGMSAHGKRNYAEITINVDNATSANIYLEKCAEGRDQLDLIVNGISISTSIDTAYPVSDTLGATAKELISLVSGINVIKVGITKDSSVDSGLDSVFLYGIDIVEGAGGET